jgi:hypothetical protein
MQPKIVSAIRNQVECQLYETHPLRLIAAKGRRIHCVEGEVWISLYDHPEDVFLRPGGVFTIMNDGLVLVEAIHSCRIRVDLPHIFDYSQCCKWIPPVFRRIFKTCKAA